MQTTNIENALIVEIGAAGIRRQWVAVRDLPAASRVCRAFIEEHDLGASQWRGGAVVDASTKKAVATVSYNGRVWLPDGAEARSGALTARW